MNRFSKFDKQVINFSRNLKRTDFAVRVYSTWLLVAIVSILVFGYVTVTKINQKAQLLKELNEINASLTKNLENLEQARNDIEDNFELLSYLYYYMPEVPEIEGYMLDFVDSLEGSTYVLEKYIPDVDAAGNNKNAINIQVTLDGLVHPVKLVQNIENMPRLTKIERISYSINKRSRLPLRNVKLNIQIYTAKSTSGGIE